MLAFYVDQPLADSELPDVLDQLTDFGETVEGGLEFKRIPFVFPAETSSQKNEDLIKIFAGHLRNAGVPRSQQCVFIMPKDGIRWALLLQMAFEQSVGYFPYVVQPWQKSEGSYERAEWIRVINLNGVMSEL